jgi:hypothetical protein
MKICFLALYNTTNEIANEMQKETGGNQLLPHLKEVVLTYSFYIMWNIYTIGNIRTFSDSFLVLFYSGQIFVMHYLWKQSGTAWAIHHPFKNI